jgi:hypothetical protein
MAEYGAYLSSPLISLVNPYCHSVCSVQQDFLPSVPAPETSIFVMAPLFTSFSWPFFDIPLKDESANFILHLLKAYTESKWQKMPHI